MTALLDASVDAYDSKVEFWHDYFSVPQWEQRTKESLLLRIPAIYHDAKEILIQMSDLPGSHIMMLLPRSPREISASMALRFMPVLHALCSSQWMERMWVLLEFSLCRSACVMDKSDYIWRSSDGVGVMERDTFTTFVQNGHRVLIGLFRHVHSFASKLKDGFLAELTEKENGQRRDLCLGEALELVSRTKCQLFRDRFLAIHMLLNKNPPPNPPTIPEDATRACHWVWQAALAKNDLSPLLLQPRESHQGYNPTVEMPSWLTGYTGLDHAEWDLEYQQASPQCIISLVDGCIETELDVVGKMEKIHYLDAEKSGEVTGVEWAIEILNSLTTTGVSTRQLTAAELIDGLNRIFPFSSIHRRYAQDIAGVVYTLEERQSQDAGFKRKVDKFLTEYFAAPCRSSQRGYAAMKLTKLLKYDTTIMGNISAQVTRLTKSRDIARSRRKRGALNGEPICEYNKCKTKKQVKYNCGTKQKPKTCYKTQCVPGYDDKIQNVPSSLTVLTKKINLCNQIRSILGNIIGNKFINSNNALCSCFPKVKQMESSGKFTSISSKGELKSENTNVIKTASELQICIANAGFSVKDNKAAVLAPLKPKDGWAFAPAAEIDTNLYKTLIDITVPCQAGSCNANVIRDTIKSYVAMSYEKMKEPITSIVGDWYEKIYDLLASILAYSQSCDDLQFTMQDVYSEIFELSTQICETLQKCDGPVIDKFLQDTVDLLQMVDDLWEARTPLSTANGALTGLLGRSNKLKDEWPNNILTTSQIVDIIRQGQFKTVSDIFKFMPIATDLPVLASDIQTASFALFDILDQYQHTAEEALALANKLSDVDWADFPDEVTINDGTYNRLVVIQLLINNKIKKSVEGYVASCKGLQAALDAFSLTNGRYSTVKSVATYQRFSTVSMDMPCSKMAKQIFKKSGLTTSFSYRTFWKCKFNQQAQYPRNHIPYMRIRGNA
ncbi:hypothetical protein N0V84_011984 [Fusarium piperis]|uniref:Uncharacterized protein n=1 Tax=Fusarium piperis TaxID=1435070 RepID=A0A9W8TAX8_9HYPO|nr:hypothetical protein N0V84_011984 [Fusarium piperis]